MKKTSGPIAADVFLFFFAVLLFSPGFAQIVEVMLLD